MIGDEPAALNTSIEDLNLIARTTNALINNDIHTIKDLFTLNDAELRDLKGFGSKASTKSKKKWRSWSSKMHRHGYQRSKIPPRARPARSPDQGPGRFAG